MKGLTTLSAVVALTLTSGYAQAVDLIGHATAQQSQDIVAQVSGVVDSQPLQIGEPVKTGQQLVALEQSDFELEVRRQVANLQLAQADLKVKKSVYNRYKELRAKKSLSQHDLDISFADYQSAKANLQLAQIDLEQAKDNLAHTKIDSQINGFIVSKNVEHGSWVEKGNLLYNVASVDNIIVRFLASEHDLAELSVGQDLTIWSDTAPENKFNSKIKRIGINLDKNLLAYPVDVEITNSDHIIKPGMSLHATTVN